MGQMRHYFLGKLSMINYNIAIHEGDANRRLASQAVKVLLLPASEVPENFKKDYDKLITLIETTIKDLPAPGLTPTRLGKIQNRTASKYLKMLYDIEEEVK